MALAKPARRPRRTQEERSAETRGRLLDATIASLVELGYARTSAQVVARRAGVSRGAQLHHYPTRIELFTAAIEHLLTRQLEEMREAMSKIRGKDRLPRVLDMLWEGFSGPLFQASGEVWIAARTDHELMRSLRPMEHRLNQQISAFWHEFFDETGIPSSRLHVALQLTVAMLRGLALEQQIRPDERRRKALLRDWVRVTERLLAEPNPIGLVNGG